MIYLAFILALALACVAGVQFFYLMFLRMVNHFDKRRVEELEAELRRTQEKLDLTSHELQIIEQKLIESPQQRDEAWPEIIDG